MWVGGCGWVWVGVGGWVGVRLRMRVMFLHQPAACN